MQPNFPLLSVVVPVYNTADYLRDCVNSIVNQTYKNLEIILVDDGSTDASGLMCDDFAAKDCRIRVFHKRNGGLSSARNFGVKKANGKYLAFVDSDDYLEIDCYRQNIEILEKSAADVSCYDIFEVYPDEVKTRDHYEGISGVFYAENHLKLLFRIWPLVWAKVYRTDFLIKNKLSFIEGLLYEDNPFVLGLWLRNPKVAIINRHLHYYRLQRPGSITTGRQVHTSDVFRMMDFVERDFKENGFDREFVWLIEWSIGNIFWLYSSTPDDLRKSFSLKMIARFAHYWSLVRGPSFKLRLIILKALLRAVRYWLRG